MGALVCWKVLEAFNDPLPIANINKTHILLVLKMDTPFSIRQYKLISLCNVIYKVITKIIASQIKHNMDGLISHYRASFITERQGRENVILA